MVDVLIGALLVGLGTWGAVETWRHASLFDVPRAYAETLAELDGIVGWCGRMLSCPHCVSYHVAALLALIAVAGFISRDDAGLGAVGCVASWVLIWLAGRKLAGVLSDACHCIERLHGE